MPNVSKPYKGLNQDSSPVNQPEGTYRFAQNAVLEGEDGNFGVIMSEQSTEDCANFPDGFIPIGKVAMPKGNTAIFLVSDDNTRSMIGILDNDCQFTVHVNADLNFSFANQIDATFNLRRGCERVVYFVDGDRNPPRLYNFDKPEDFQDNLGNWIPNNFNLVKTYNDVPIFEGFEILQTGLLAAGSYNFAIQYLDQDLNPTEWITSEDTINIYHDNTLSTPFSSIRGSTNEQTDAINFGPTNKSIRVTLNNLDTSYPFYRLAAIEATTGSGEVSRVGFTSEIPTQIRNFTYTGNNIETEGTVEEIQQFSNLINGATSIDQIENTLILSGVNGKSVNWCKLQKYASKIKTDLVFEEIVLNDVTVENNPKRGTVHVEKMGYMPGEIYSFGLVFVFEGGLTSPVFHIPGRAVNYPSEMSTDNVLMDTFYVDNNNCGVESYWGVDSQGQDLTGQRVRHHRFPLRSEVQKPLLTSSDENSSIQTNFLYVTANGEVGSEYGLDTVDFVVTYEVNGSQVQEARTLNLNEYDPTVGSERFLIATSLSTITLVSIQENNGVELVDPSTNSGLIYQTESDSLTSTSDDSIYKSEIMGVRFSGIDLPSIEETNGHRPIGYYIVRNERTEDQRTILDTGVLTPLLIEEREGVSKFVAHGHLMPEADNIKEDVFGLIHPEHKFREREYTSTTEMIQEGYYQRTSKNLSSELVQDVQPGTSYDAENNQRRERDSDGFDLHVLTRNNNLDYVEQLDDEFILQGDIANTFYLDTLFAKNITDTDNARKDIYNISADNKIGIVQLNKKLDKSKFEDKLPYVVMKRQGASPYANFRVLPYFKENDNITFFTSDTDNEVTVFNGDSYISSMRYMSSMFYDIRIRNRRTRSGLLNFIVGVLSVIAGSVLVVTGVGTAAGIAVIGFGVSQVASGLNKEQLSRVYQDLYEQGLKDTVQDADTEAEFGGNPEDDEIQHFFDVATNLWFESNVNMNWRNGLTLGLTDFLDSPTGYDESQLNSYAIEKVTGLDATADGGRTYQGYTKAEYYNVNDDFFRRNKEKVFFHLGLEFDCCSDCLEEYPYRVAYSLQAFQEELTDNYRVFLPNNYRDIPGETGVIVNSFTIQNNLYIQTEQALWHLPQNYQERVTGDIVSFIGTGDFLGVPPRKIVDDETGNSGGCQHKWSTIKTPFGVFFVSEEQRTVFHFDGNKLVPISDKGLYSWFKNNVPIEYDMTYARETGQVYPYRDNPSNPFGTGFITAYDSRNQRILITKKDFLYDANLTDPESDYILCATDGGLVIHRNLSEILKERAANGWEYLGIADDTCALSFQRVAEEEVTIISENVISNNTDIHAFFDTTGSFGEFTGPCSQDINAALDAWIEAFREKNPAWEGNLYKYQNETERWLNFASEIADTTYLGQDLSEKEILVISFVNECHPLYHGSFAGYRSPGLVQPPRQQFLDDYDDFVNNVYPQYKSFRGIHYPIVFGPDSPSCNAGSIEFASKAFLEHTFAAIHGVDMNFLEVTNKLPNINGAFSASEWEDFKNAFSTNPYPDDGLENYGWSARYDRFARQDGVIITPNQFSQDIENLLESFITTTEETVTVTSLEFDTFPGESYEPELVKNSWTISYNLKADAWASWHSYLPSFWIHSPDKLYSWQDFDPKLYRHNSIGRYQNFYGLNYSFVVDFVSLSDPIQTRTWEALVFQTLAEKWDFDARQFYEVEQRTFNKMILYNRNQCTGLMTLIPKDQFTGGYLGQQVRDLGNGVTLISKDEKNWNVNNFRDVRINYESPIFITDLVSRQPDYFIDKILNDSSLDQDKPWYDQEKFRDKYLSIRLIFDNFDNTRLSLNYSVEDDMPSP
jgi:hypothetical protein